MQKDSKKNTMNPLNHPMFAIVSKENILNTPTQLYHPSSQFSTEYRGSNKSAQATVVNPDIVNDSGIFISHYLQRVSSRVNLGAELVYQFGPQARTDEILSFSKLLSTFTWVILDFPLIETL